MQDRHRIAVLLSIACSLTGAAGPAGANDVDLVSITQSGVCLDGDPLRFEVLVTTDLSSGGAACLALGWQAQDTSYTHFPAVDSSIQPGEGSHRFAVEISSDRWNRLDELVLVALLSGDPESERPVTLAEDRAVLGFHPEQGLLLAGPGCAVIHHASPVDLVTGPTAGPPPISVEAEDLEWLASPSPTYPPLARQANLEGEIVLKALFGTDGAPETIEILSGPDVFLPETIATVKQWRARPLSRDGEPVRFRVTIRLRFSLEP